MNLTELPKPLSQCAFAHDPVYWHPECREECPICGPAMKQTDAGLDNQRRAVEQMRETIQKAREAFTRIRSFVVEAKRLGIGDAMAYIHLQCESELNRGSFTKDGGQTATAEPPKGRSFDDYIAWLKGEPWLRWRIATTKEFGFLSMDGYDFVLQSRQPDGSWADVPIASDHVPTYQHPDFGKGASEP
jgi:hypothetical protein